ncbi:MAG TPA: PilZ domain-containing protein [Clostridiales bacterium]|nr:PilZ domain-containing protein [Clostridiales bacterium]
MIFKILNDFVKVQRRQYYRLNINFDVEFHLYTSVELKVYRTLFEDQALSEEEKGKLIDLLIDSQEENISKGLVLDISGGGMRFQSKDQLKKDDFINLHFSLDTNSITKEYNIQAVVIESSKSYNKIYDDKNVYENRVQFMNISKEDRENIVRFIFYEQRKQRQREKGDTNIWTN